MEVQTMAKIIDLYVHKKAQQVQHQQDLNELLKKVKALDMTSALLGESLKDAKAFREISAAFQQDERIVSVLENLK